MTISRLSYSSRSIPKQKLVNDEITMMKYIQHISLYTKLKVIYPVFVFYIFMIIYIYNISINTDTATYNVYIYIYNKIILNIMILRTNMPSLYTYIENPLTQNVRLVDGQHPAEGRVEIYNPNIGAFGAIQSSSWDLNDAKVVCNMLGYPYALYARRTSHGIYGYGPWYSVAYYFRCAGTENSIYNCNFYDYTSQRTDTAGVACSGTVISPRTRNCET